MQYFFSTALLHIQAHIITETLQLPSKLILDTQRCYQSQLSSVLLKDTWTNRVLNIYFHRRDLSCRSEDSSFKKTHGNKKKVRQIILLFFSYDLKQEEIKKPTSKIHQPSYPCDGHLPLSGSFTELKYKNRCKLEGKKINVQHWSNSHQRLINIYFLKKL